MFQMASFSIIGVKLLDSFRYVATFCLGVYREPRRLVCHASCMSIVLSHNTAKAVYQAAYSVSAIGTEPCSPAKIYGARPSKELLDSAADWLARHNVALDDDIYIVGVELCALQAATYLPFRELVEYYFELCGAYSLGRDASTAYTERFALTSTSSLKHFFNSLTDCKGLELARKAIRCVRDGCRSPMETAFVMMLTLPRREGGLGISEIETDYEVKVTAAAKDLTRREKFYMDAYLKRSRTDIEYNGFQHDAEEDRAIDEERKNALASMGYGIISVSRYSFMHASAFARVMEAIKRKEGIRPSRLPKDFAIKQEELRRFVLRRFIEEKKRIEELLCQDAEQRSVLELEHAVLEGISLNDPTINDAPAIDDMQVIELDCPEFAQTSTSTPEGRVYGARTEAD